MYVCMCVSLIFFTLTYRASNILIPSSNINGYEPNKKRYEGQRVTGWVFDITAYYNNALVTLRTALFLRTGPYFFFIYEPLGGFDPPMAQAKALGGGAITEMHYPIVVDMSINGSKMYLGSILMNSAVCHYCGKIRENGLTVP